LKTLGGTYFYTASRLAGAFPPRRQHIEYRYDKVRELRRLGAMHRPGSTGCIEKERVHVGSREALSHKKRIAV